MSWSPRRCSDARSRFWIFLSSCHHLFRGRALDFLEYKWARLEKLNKTHISPTLGFVLLITQALKQEKVCWLVVHVEDQAIWENVANLGVILRCQFFWFFYPTNLGSNFLCAWEIVAREVHRKFSTQRPKCVSIVDIIRGKFSACKTASTTAFVVFLCLGHITG